MGIRQRVGRLFMAKELDGMTYGLQVLENAYRDGKYTLTPDVLIAKLQETDSTQLADLITRLSRDYTSVLGGQEDTESMRR